MDVNTTTGDLQVKCWYIALLLKSYVCVMCAYCVCNGYVMCM